MLSILARFSQRWCFWTTNVAIALPRDSFIPLVAPPSGGERAEAHKDPRKVSSMPVGDHCAVAGKKGMGIRGHVSL